MKVQSVISPAGTVFDPPPASVPRNIFNTNDPNQKLLGFFDVTEVDIQRTFVFPTEFKENIDARVVCSPFQRRS